MIFETPAISASRSTIDLLYSEDEFKAILRPYYEGFNKTTENADAKGSMEFMHPQGVIVQRDVSSTFGKEALTDLFKRWYSFTGPYYFNRYNEKYSGGGDWITVESQMKLVKVNSNEVIVKGDVMHIWKKDGDKWLIFYEQYHVDK
ncbi:unnamed protein product [Caenorhabditis bovis]|uniref:DUF4440 domain-containing protein n=1 Tax=Caenorhabditis bovis TaxID=2654633 RepID=A0A8S1EB82_9PELO|nr:unnamed protein product [Caenorhabditis bovis]